MHNFFKNSIFFICIILVSCKEYKYVITDIKHTNNSCIYYFYPVNNNAIQWLNADTIKCKRITYSFEKRCNEYTIGNVIQIKGKNKMIRYLIL